MSDKLKKSLYTERFNDYVSLMRRHEATKNKIIIAGNVCTPEATEQIIKLKLIVLIVTNLIIKRLIEVTRQLIEKTPKNQDNT